MLAMRYSSHMSTIISTTEAAQRFGVDAATIRRWATDGKIPARKTPGGVWRIIWDEEDDGAYVSA